METTSKIFKIASHGIKAEVIITEPIYAQDLRKIASELELFYQYFWGNSDEDWRGVCDNVKDYISKIQERFEYIQNISLNN